MNHSSQKIRIAGGRGGYPMENYGSYQKIGVTFGEANALSTTTAFETIMNFSESQFTHP